MAWLSGYTYRKSITLSRASGAVTDYQMPVTVGYGAAADVTSVKFAGLGATVLEAPYDDDTWVNPTNIYADDATRASITATSFDTNDYSQVLTATLFANAIPTGSVIKGIKVEIDKYHANGDVIDAVVQLTKDNTTRVGDNKADTSTHWPDADSAVSYGDNTDLWGTTWTPEEINSPNFGVHIVAQAHGTDSDAYIDFVRITVYYQYLVYTDSHCATDFDDLRFTTSDGTTLLDYWLEDKTDSDHAHLWLEFDSIGTSATTFYMYYGNAAATAVSNGTNTFLFFDDFEDGTLDKWSTGADFSCQSTLKWGGSYAAKATKNISTTNLYGYLDFPETFAWEYRFRTDALPYAKLYIGLQTQNAATRYLGVAMNNGKINYNDGSYHDYPTALTYVANTWYRIQYYCDTSSSNHNFTVYRDTTSGGAVSTVYDNSGEPNTRIRFVNDANDSASYYIDNVIVRNWRTTEPTWGSWGSEVTGSVPAKLKTFNGLTTPKIKTINGLSSEKWKTINGLV